MTIKQYTPKVIGLAKRMLDPTTPEAKAFNARMQSSIINGGVMAGAMQPMNQLNAAADIVTGLRQVPLNKTMKAQDFILAQAKRQLTENELMRYMKDLTAEAPVRKIIQRAQNETYGTIDNAVQNMPNLFRR